MIAHGALLWECGEPQAGLEMTRRAHAGAVRAGMHGWKTHAETGIARILLGLGEHAEAISRLSHLFDKTSRPLDACVTAFLLGFAHLDLGEIDQAQEWFDRAQVHAAHDDPARLAMAHQAMACLATVRGDWAEAARQCHDSIAKWEDAQLHSRSLVARCWGAVAEHRLGHQPQALRMLDAALQIHTDCSSPLQTSVLAAACEALERPGPAAPAVGRWFIYARLARVAWGLSLPGDGAGG